MKKRSVTSEEQHAVMLGTPIPKLVTKMALPTVVIQLITIIYNTADTYFVSKISNSASAAVGVAFSLMSLIQAFGFGIGQGAGSLISRKLGAKQDEDAVRYASSACFFALLIGSLVMTFGLVFLEPLMRLFGSTDAMLPHTCDYAKYILMAAPIHCFSFVLTIILRSEGGSRYALIASVSGGLFNLILDPIFIFGLNMGTGGAGLATAISQTLTLVIQIVLFASGKSFVVPNPKKISKKIRDYWEILKTGFPTIARQGLASVASTLLTINASAVSATPEEAIAGVTIANKVYLLVRNVVLGIGQGMQPVAGYNYGAKDYRRTKQTFWFATAVGTAFCVVAAAVIALFPEQVIRFFRDDSTIVAVGREALLFACAVMPFLAFSTYANQLYQCLGFKGAATFLACCRQGVFFIPLIFVLPRVFGLHGVALTQPGADFLTFLACVPFMVWFFRKVLVEPAQNNPGEARSSEGYSTKI